MLFLNNTFVEDYYVVSKQKTSVEDYYVVSRQKTSLEDYYVVSKQDICRGLLCYF